MASRLEKVANMFMIVACTVIVGDYVYHKLPGVKSKPGVFHSGEHIQATPAVGLSDSPRTLLLATSNTCPYCLASMPYFKDLAEEAHKAGTRVIAISDDPEGVNQAYLASHGITPEKVLSGKQSGVFVPQIPTLILVRSDGTVIDSWTGQADSALEKSVAKLIRN